MGLGLGGLLPGEPYLINAMSYKFSIDTGFRVWGVGQRSGILGDQW